jgi:homoserine kinase
MIRQSANLAAFVTAMFTGDLELIRRSMEDHIIEPQRKHLIPHFDELKDLALTLGALGCSISGSGPAIFALCQEKTNAHEIAIALQKTAEVNGMPSRSFVGGINNEGVMLK